MSQVQQLDSMKTKNKKYCRPSPATWPNEKKMNNYCKPSPATWPNENKEQKVLQAKSSNLTYNRFCYTIRSFNEIVVFVNKNEPSPATWPIENKEQKVLQAKSSNLTQWKKDEQLLQAKSSNLTQWKQRTKSTAGQVQQLDLQLLLSQN